MPSALWGKAVRGFTLEGVEKRIDAYPLAEQHLPIQA